MTVIHRFLINHTLHVSLHRKESPMLRIGIVVPSEIMPDILSFISK